jgi:hypothetical protein
VSPPCRSPSPPQCALTFPVWMSARNGPAASRHLLMDLALSRSCVCGIVPSERCHFTSRRPAPPRLRLMMTDGRLACLVRHAIEASNGGAS